MNINLFNDDCISVFPGIREESIDLLVTDCPFKIVSGGCTIPRGGIFRAKEAKTGKLFKYNDIAFSEWLPEAYRVLKQGTHAYIMVNERNIAKCQIEAEKCGFKFSNILIWEKNTMTPNRYYMKQTEYILMLRKGPARTINKPGTSNIIKANNIVGNKRHPTEKSVELLKVLIENSSVKGNIVLDPFMGSGSTGVACIETNRNFIGIEIDDKYFKIASQRCKEEKAYKQLDIFETLDSF